MYHSYGIASAETLVLLHPGGVLHSVWLPLIRHWSGTCRVIAFDILPHNMPPLDEAARGIVDALTAGGVQHFHLLGASVGGNIALHVALQAPDRVRSLVLDSAQAGAAEPPAAVSGFLSVLDFIIRLVPAPLVENFMLRQFRHLAAEDRAAVREELKRAGKQAFVRHAKASLRHHVAPRLHEIRMPTLLLAGGRDMLTKSGEAHKLLAGIPGARLELIPEAGHVTFLTHADRFLSLADAFIRENTAAQQR